MRRLGQNILTARDTIPIGDGDAFSLSAKHRCVARSCAQQSREIFGWQPQSANRITDYDCSIPLGEPTTALHAVKVS